MNCLSSQSVPKRSGNSGPYFNVLNSDSELSRVRDNSDYVELVIIPSGGGLSFETFASNLRVLDMGTAETVRPVAIWGPAILVQAEGGLNGGICTFKGQ